MLIGRERRDKINEKYLFENNASSGNRYIHSDNRKPRSGVDNPRYYGRQHSNQLKRSQTVYTGSLEDTIIYTVQY